MALNDRDRAAIAESVLKMDIGSWAPLTVDERDLLRRALFMSSVNAPETAVEARKLPQAS